ncbi:MAG: Maf family nucleotide pyrophosphatase [Pseudomonadota bacterium]
MGAPSLILASASPRRLSLLKQIGVTPTAVIPADIDEQPRAKETPVDYASRLAREKAEAVAASHRDAVVLGCDTVVACGRRILPKAEEAQTARTCLELISGRSHRVYSGVALFGPGDHIRTRLVETRVKVRRLSLDHISAYLATDEWRGKAGGYAIQGQFAIHIVNLIGSYTNVVGLPLYETANLLAGAGVHA